MVNVNYAKLQQRYGGKYVARIGNSVIAFGKTFEELIKQLERKHLINKNFSFAYIPPKGAICIYVNKVSIE